MNATRDGRRGPFVAVTAGNSFGGGQKRPGNLLNNHINTIICATMLGNWAIKRLAGFANGMFQSFAPSLHSFYTEQRSLLYRAAPYLCCIFLDSVSIFSACTFNFGPSTVTLPHVDAANLAWGWCAITALGYFNPDLGGHLILWDLKLVIHFLPGSTILIPSALLRHLNVSIQQGKTRYSFTQYTAGGLFCWVYNSGCSDIDFYRTATPEQIRERKSDRAQRWEDGVKMFMIWNAETREFENDVEQ
ncbi:hypothetical protein C8R43DRAFT_881788 [Mycena crocata]|nr:hypothetical protein C8R43DRAFT_881788 [Mycena crocata]